jgi:hypothetical protein
MAATRVGKSTEFATQIRPIGELGAIGATAWHTTGYAA